MAKDTSERYKMSLRRVAKLLKAPVKKSVYESYFNHFQTSL